MKKGVFWVILGSLVATQSWGAGGFVGAEVGNLSTQITVESANYSETNTDTGSTVNIIAGFEKEKARTYLAWHMPDTENGVTVNWLTFNNDFFFSGSDSLVRPFLGIGFGYFGYTIENFYADGTSYQLSAFTMNPEVGIEARVKHFTLEANYRYGIGLSSADNASVFKGTLDNVSSFNIGAAFHF